MPRSVTFLISDNAADTASNDNHVRIPQAFADCGWHVAIGDPDHLRMDPAGLCVNEHPLHQADMVWPMGFGPRAGFLDRAHLLNQLPQKKLITPMAQQVLGHGKAQWSQHCAPTHISNDSDHLYAIAKQYDGDWVLKPLAGSYGRGVQHLQPGQYPVIQQTMTAQPGAYFVLQRFVPEIIDGEIRTLVAGGEIIGSYRRQPQQDIRANLSEGGQALPVAEREIDQRLIRRIVDDLVKLHIGYAAIDTVGGYLMEVNLANPGGLGTLSAIYHQDFGGDVVRAVSAQRGL